MLHVHRAERADGLVDALRALVADPLEDPFAAEVVAVPTRGMERWLTQRMATGLGICANVDFPTPRRLTQEAVAAASGIDADGDPWLPERLVWPLLEVVDGALHEPWLAALAQHLAGPGAGRRFGVVRHLAGLFDRYALHRPELTRAWAAGEQDGGWQGELWRRLHERIDVADPAERLAAACARLEAEPALSVLPRRLSLFGLTRLPAAHVAVLRAIAAAREVHLFLLHPSPALWASVGEVLATRGEAVTRRGSDPTAALARNRLLASWGQDARELQLVVAGGGPREDHHHPVEHPEGTLLAAIQADVRADRPPVGAPLPGAPDQRRPLDPDDRSVQVHACHGRARQVEVVRDAILHLLEEDPSLEPRDVIVMCPDIEAFAPLIQATFGAGEVTVGEDDDELAALPPGVRPPDLRVRLADRSLRQTNPVLGVAAHLLELIEQRLTASQVLDLAGREPVRRRFRFDDDDLTRVEEWVTESGIRWGLDAAHRASFKLADVPAGTWRAGLDRLLVGVTMTEDEQRLFGDVLPLEDVESGAIDLVGRVAELVDRLQAALATLARSQSVKDWAAALASAADALAATTPRDAWQRAELQRLLDDVVSEAAGHTTPLAPAEVRSLLAERLQGRPTRANFRTGHLTICTLVPMRSVPHRVVCLLGLDDGVFPRRAPRDGDDHLLEDAHVGERDGRHEDRQQLLDALLAATDRLVIAYTGKDERTNTPRPPAVPVGELLDVVDRTARLPDGGTARNQVVVEHPLQPFDPRNFTPGELAGDGPWSFDHVTLDGARALAGPRAEPPAFLPAALPAAPPGLVEVADLVGWVERPVRAFLRQRLGVTVTERDDEVADAIPVALDALEEWHVGRRLLEARLAGVDARSAYLAEKARGTLPPDMLGKPVIDKVLPTVQDIVAGAAARVGDLSEAGSLDVRVDLGGGRALSGTVAGIAGDVLRTITYSRVSARHRLAAWVRLLALTAAHPGRAFEAVTIGRGRQSGVQVARIPPLEAGVAREQLALLLDLYDAGMREPLPIACLASAAYAEAALAGGDAVAAARKEWESEWAFPKEDREPEHRMAFGGVLSCDELLADGRFSDLAQQLWAGLLAVEER